MRTNKLLAVTFGMGALAMIGCNGKTTATLQGASVNNTSDLPSLPGAGEGGGAGGGTGGGTVSGPTCALGTAWQGFSGIDLTADRVDNTIGADRGRVKPYTALMNEFPRVLGNTPSLLSTMGSTFGAAPARWYEEATGGAITSYSSFRIAFQGCLTATSGSAFGSQPTQTTAATQCQTWEQKYWSRTPSSAEVNACADYAVNGTTAETSANRRWAYACASVLTAAGFTTY